MKAYDSRFRVLLFAMGRVELVFMIGDGEQGASR